MDRQYIIWDLGATKCAAAMVNVNQAGYVITQQTRVKLKECDSLSDMVERLHSAMGVVMSDIDAICIAGAGQYNGEAQS